MDPSLLTPFNVTTRGELWYPASPEMQDPYSANITFKKALQEYISSERRIPCIDEILARIPSAKRGPIETATLGCGLEVALPTAGALASLRIDASAYDQFVAHANRKAGEEIPLRLRLRRNVSPDEVAAHHFLNSTRIPPLLYLASNSPRALRLSSGNFEGSIESNGATVKTMADRELKGTVLRYDALLNRNGEVATLNLSYKRFKEGLAVASLDLEVDRKKSGLRGCSVNSGHKVEFSFRDDGTLASATVYEAMTTSGDVELRTIHSLTTKEGKGIPDTGGPVFPDENIVSGVMETIEGYESRKSRLDYTATLYSLAQAFRAEEIDTGKLESFAHLKFT